LIAGAESPRQEKEGGAAMQVLVHEIGLVEHKDGVGELSCEIEALAQLCDPTVGHIFLYCRL
jgi:hypothetical protein